MESGVLDAVHRLSDEELVRHLQQLAARERHATVELVAHLAELDTRKLYLARGFGSLFEYCTEALRLAEHAAFNRIEAARASRRFPVILQRLADGTLNLSGLRLLAPHLTPENHLRVLQQAAGRSKREIEWLVACLAPRPDVGSMVRRLADSAAAGQSASAASTAAGATVTKGPDPSTRASTRTTTGAPTGATTAALTGAEIPSGSRPDTAAGAAARRGVISPLSPERYRVQFTVDRETHDDLRRVQDLLRREIPDGDPALIFGRALKLLLEEVARRKTGAVPRPRRGAATAPGSRHVPARVRRAVWLRDGGRCAFVSRDGRRCRQRAHLELHHVEPYAIGGETNEANLALRCRAHNLFEHARLFGPFVADSHPAHSPRGELGTRPNGLSSTSHDSRAQERDHGRRPGARIGRGAPVRATHQTAAVAVSPE